MAETKFEQWAILEIMGHNRFAGLVSEETIGGASFVRVDVPEAEGVPAFTKFFGASSIYCITPVAEEIARGVARASQKRPIEVYDLPADMRKLIEINSVTVEARPDEPWMQRCEVPVDDELVDDDDEYDEVPGL